MQTTKNPGKKRIAVLFGGRSPEHDVSVVSGLQVLNALDPEKYEGFPVYISPQGLWLTGDVLRERANYMLDEQNLKKTRAVTLDLSPINRTVGKRGRLLPRESGLLEKGKPVEEFDAAIPVFHGYIGEDGNIQGLMETADIPYAGTRTMASAILMDKAATKYFLKALDIPVLPCAVLRRPAQGYFIPENELKALAEPIGFPAIIKPTHMGSSIGVAKVKNIEELSACLPAVFEYDDSAILEPFVENLVEYNVAVSKAFGGGIKTSAIERPKAVDELLDFKQKYLAGAESGSNKLGGTKNPGAISEGMLSLTRELNPKLDAKMESNIREWALRMFDAMNGTGAPRIDFIGNSKSGEIWMNEVNPLPGSFGYFLWEAAKEPILFTDFLSGLIEEAFFEYTRRRLPKDPVPVDARLFKRAG